MELDTTDRHLLNLVQSDGRISNVDLADEIGLSPSAALRRLRRLEDDGVIERYVAMLDPARIRRDTAVLVEISLVSQEETVLETFEAAILEVPEVMSCRLMAGESDYLIHVACEDVNDYERIHRTHLAILPGVTRIRSSFALRTVCDRTAYTLPA